MSKITEAFSALAGSLLLMSPNREARDDIFSGVALFRRATPQPHLKPHLPEGEVALSACVIPCSCAAPRRIFAEFSVWE